MALSKRRRFEVFKRDGFKCAYCGGTPPNVMLEVVHIIPKSKGGTDDINNLITACFDCNRGKSNIPIGQLPEKVSANLEKAKRIEEQTLAYYKFLNKLKRKREKECKEVEDVFKLTYPDKKLTARFIITSVKRFLKHLPVEEVKEAMAIATERIPDNSDRCLTYYCGICWHKIKGIKEDG